MIKKLAVGVLLISGSMSAMADPSVAVSIGQPGFYGQIVLGNPYPAPQVVYAQPVIIQPPPVAVVQQPVYLHVPPGHIKKWSRYCRNYGACGQQVYFVQDAWYQNVYSPRYNAYAGRPGNVSYHRGHDDRDGHWHDDRHKHKGKDKGHGRGRGHDHD